MLHFLCGSERNANLSFSVLHFWSLESRKEEGWYCTRAAGANLHNNDKTQSPNHGGPISDRAWDEVLPLASDDNSFLFIIALGCWPNWLEIRFLFKIPAQLCQLLNDNNHVPPVQLHHTSCNHPCGVRLTTISSVCSRQFLPPQHTRPGSLLNTICKIQAIIEIAILHCSPANFVASSFHCLCSCWRTVMSSAAAKEGEEGQRNKSVMMTSVAWQFFGRSVLLQLLPFLVAQLLAGQDTERNRDSCCCCCCCRESIMWSCRMGRGEDVVANRWSGHKGRLESGQSSFSGY